MMSFRKLALLLFLSRHDATMATKDGSVAMMMDQEGPYAPPEAAVDQILKGGGGQGDDTTQRNVLDARVISGDYVSLNEYPFYARTFWSDGRHSCGGSLVTPEFVLTAAHCPTNFAAIEVGALCTDSDEDNCGQHREYFVPQGVYDHPGWWGGGQNFSFGYDLRLLHLSGKSSIEPVTMDLGGLSKTYSTGDPVWVIGLGTVDPRPGCEIYPSKLKHVEIDYVDNDLCSDIIPQSVDKGNKNIICAGPSYEGAPWEGGCRGDSGGPLYDKEQGVLVGVVSAGPKCGELPGMYGRIAFDHNWSWIVWTICTYHSSPKPYFCGGGLYMLDQSGFMIRSEYDDSLCVGAKKVEAGSKLKLKNCNSENDKQKFVLSSSYGQISVASNTGLCLTRVKKSLLTLEVCQNEPNEDQKWVYDGLALSDFMLREEGSRVLSIQGDGVPELGSTLKVRKKDYSLTDNSQSWDLIKV